MFATSSLPSAGPSVTKTRYDSIAPSPAYGNHCYAMKACLLPVVGSLLFWSSSAFAQPEAITKTEIALLPAYCPDTNTFGYGGEYNPSPNAAKWVSMMGRGFWAMHHYCWALIRLTRAEKAGVPPVVQRGYRQAAIGDLYYVVEHSPPDFIMLPEIYTKIGEVQLLLKQFPDARKSFELARSLKADYWPAYFHWADHLRRSGETAKARALVEEGLSHSPDAKPLQGLLATLGGDAKAIKPRDPAGAASPPKSE